MKDKLYKARRDQRKLDPDAPSCFIQRLLCVGAKKQMQLISSDFKPGGPIPIRFTCEGDDISPEFSWRDAPPETESLVLTVRDPDARKAGGFTHWVLYNIPPNLKQIGRNVPKQPTVPGIGLQGKNDGGEIG